MGAQGRPDREPAPLPAGRLPLPVFLAGGINPSNVRKAMEMVHPDGIDLCSGVEAEPGRKDPKKLFELLGEIRKWEKENTERMR